MGDENSFLEELCEGDELLSIELENAKKQISYIAGGNKNHIDPARLHIMNSILLMVAQEYDSRKGKIQYKTGPASKIRRQNQKSVDIDPCKTIEQLEQKYIDHKTSLFTDHISPKRSIPTAEQTIESVRSLAMQIDALEKLWTGNINKAEQLLSQARMLHPQLSNSSLYCNFLDATGKLDDEYIHKAVKYWNLLMLTIIHDQDKNMNFNPSEVSRNETIKFEDSSIEHRLIHVKRSRQKEDMDKEFRIAHFLHNSLGYGNIVPTPICLSQSGEHFYVAQRIFDGRPIKDALGIKKETDEKVLKLLLKTLDRYQINVANNSNIARSYGFNLSPIDYKQEFNRTFLQRLFSENKNIDPAKISENIEYVLNVLNNQQLRGVHGDMHSGNILLHMLDNICIIDSEKLSLGAGVLDWANFLLHTKVEIGKDLEKHMKLGKEFFSHQGRSTSEYFLAYNCAKAFKCSHMAGTVFKYWGHEGNKRIKKYLDEAIHSLNILKEITPSKNTQKMQQLIEEYSKVRQMHSP